MKTTRALTNKYISFFTGCADFAISPYTKTFLKLAEPTHQGDHADYIGAMLITGILTVAIPVLPAIFAVTSALAMVAFSLAIATMFLLYPCALVLDLLTPSPNPALSNV